MYNRTATDLLNEKLSQDRDVQVFLKKYEAYGTISNRMYTKYRRMHYQDWLDQNLPIPFTTQQEAEPMIEITLPQERFRDLITQEDYLAHLEQENKYNRNIVMRERQEEMIRNSNPSVQKAWEKYQMLLELSRT